MEKVVRDGKVAVLVSIEYGAGWYTWNGVTQGEQILFDPEIVEWVEQGKPKGRIPYFEQKYPDAYFGGFEDLVIGWIPVGEKFVIDEYDGYESIRMLDDVIWMTA